MHPHRIATLVLVGLLLGCASTSFLPELPVPELPESLDGDGLLVGKIYMPGSYRWNNSQVLINGRVYNTSLRDGYLAMRLSPGEYTLQNLRVTGWNDKVSRAVPASPYERVRGGAGGSYRAPTYNYYVPGAPTYVHYTLLPIDQKFTIEANRVTSIGMVLLITDRDPKETKKFYTFRLDNSREMSHFLDANYPKLMSALADRSLLLASANYQTADKLPNLRQMIAMKEAGAGHYFVAGRNIVVYGSAGSIVLLQANQTGKDARPTPKVLDTGTLADIKQLQAQGERLNFLSADAQVLILDKEQLIHRAIPYRVQPQRFLRFGENSIMVVDNRRRFLVSNDDGRTWANDETAMLEKPSDVLQMLATRDGVYVYTLLGAPDSIILHSYQNAANQIIPAPREDGRVPGYSGARQLVATDAGLYMNYFVQDFYFKPNGQTDWQVRSKPAGKCGIISFDPAGRVLDITCDKTPYRSEDGGRSWVKRETAAPPATAPSS